MKPITAAPIWMAFITLTACGLTTDSGSSSTGEEAAIQAVLIEAYVEGIFVNRDLAAVQRGFHPDFVMTVYDDGQAIVAPLQMWVDRRLVFQKS